MSKIRVLATIPSTYGLLAWVIMLSIFFASPITVDSISNRGTLIFAFVLFIFVVSIITNYRLAAITTKVGNDIAIITSDKFIFIIYTLIGVYGLFLYITDVAVMFGGITEFFNKYTESALDIRLASAEIKSMGFQISYFSWISIFFGMFIVGSNRVGLFLKALVFCVIFAEFALNLTFIDRTRPTTILITLLLGYMFKNPRKELSIWVLSAVSVTPLAIFIVFANFSQKFDPSVGIFDTMLIYLLGGIAYLDSLMSDNAIAQNFVPERTFLPVAKLYEIFSGHYVAPSQILEFRFVPFPTNVGTSLEPFYSDGGLVFVIFIFPVFVILGDYLAIRVISSRTLLGLFIWTHFVYSAMISFFVSRLNEPYLYLFVALWCLDEAWRALVQNQARRKLVPRNHSHDC